MKTLAFFFLGLAEVLAIVASCLHFHRRGFRLGQNEGYQTGNEIGRAEGYDSGFIAGHAAAERWRDQVELDVQAEREKIWRHDEL